ncbi:pentapeptide repeat-containing protein [Candidatus Uabimicrobium sp. HlEnr_7]
MVSASFAICALLFLTLGCVFTGCVFTGCVFAGCVFTGCVFAGCVFTGCVFTGCVFTGCVVSLNTWLVSEVVENSFSTELPKFSTELLPELSTATCDD